MSTTNRRRWRPRRSDDTGSLPLAMLLVLVGVSLSALLVPVVVNQITATRTSAERDHALHAAQAGIDVAMAQIRAATDSVGDGALENLPPCELAGALNAEGTLRPPRYQVKITYRDSAGNDLGCPPLDVPTVAWLVSTGTEKPAGAFGAGTKGTRTIDATYRFQLTNDNIPGGQIRLDNTTFNLCLDAGTVDPVPAGTRLQVQTCQSGSSRQRFAYNEYLNIKLVGSESDTAPLGMCVDGDAATTGTYVTFQKCDPAVRRQVWSLNNSSQFRGTTTGVTADGSCLAAQSPAGPGSYVILRPCGEANQTFRPADEVGAGMAGVSTGQIVNYEQFGRCLEVTDSDVDKAYMIAWFCKQEPDPTRIGWNQRWTLPAHGATGPIRTVAGDGNGYCLRSPGPTAATRFVTLTACPATGTPSDDTRWTVRGDTGDYATSYQIVDAHGLCLAVTDLADPDPNAFHRDGTSKVKVETCNGSDLQKWNASPDLKRPQPLKDINEK